MIRAALIRTMDKVAFDQSGFDQGALVRTMDRDIIDQSGFNQGALEVYLHIRRIEKNPASAGFFSGARLQNM